MRWNPILDTAKEAKNLGLDKPWDLGGKLHTTILLKEYHNKLTPKDTPL